MHKEVKAMDSKTTTQHNKLMQLENSMLMYGVYNADTLEKFLDTVPQIHNTISSHEIWCRFLILLSLEVIK